MSLEKSAWVTFRATPEEVQRWRAAAEGRRKAVEPGLTWSDWCRRALDREAKTATPRKRGLRARLPQ